MIDNLKFASFRLWIVPDLVDLDKSATSAGKYGPTDTHPATKCEKKASNK